MVSELTEDKEKIFIEKKYLVKLNDSYKRLFRVATVFSAASFSINLAEFPYETFWSKCFSLESVNYKINDKRQPLEAVKTMCELNFTFF